VISQEKLKERLSYNPLTGEFKWNTSPPRGPCIVGMKAGSPDNHGYLKIMVDSKLYKAHRLAWLYVNGSFPAGDIDHINHKRTDNRIENLRTVERKLNQKNLTKARNNTSGFTGVIFNKKTSKWTAQIQVENKKIYLGSFDDIECAIATRIEANKKYDFHNNHGKGDTL